MSLYVFVEMSEYVGNKKASELLGVGRLTLYKYAESGILETIRTPGNKRLYNVKKFLQENVRTKDKLEKRDTSKRRICYCRVSTRGQADDLERQVEYMKKLYPNHEIIQDIGSGLNYKRKGLKEIISAAIKGTVEEVVVAYKDRLARFGYEMIEDLITTYSSGRITILNKVSHSPQEEMVIDLISIINVFSARINGLRKYKRKIDFEFNNEE